MQVPHFSIAFYAYPKACLENLQNPQAVGHTQAEFIKRGE
jgi:hypothetical protein